MEEARSLANMRRRHDICSVRICYTLAGESLTCHCLRAGSVLDPAFGVFFSLGWIEGVSRKGGRRV